MANSYTEVKVKFNQPTSYHLLDSWQIIKFCNGIHFTNDPKSDVILIGYDDLIYASSDDYDRWNQHRCVIIFELADITDYFDDGNIVWNHTYKLLEQLTTRVVLVTQNHYPLELDNVTVIQYDLLHNRSKAYYTSDLKYTSTVGGYQFWYYSNSFNTPVVPQEFYNNQLFINGPTKCYRDKKFLFAARNVTNPREQMASTLESFIDDGYFLFKNRRLPHEQDMTVWDPKGSNEHENYNYVPLPSEIYENSFINVYNETNVKPGIWHRTEKTIEPVIRMQMILPLASPGFIEYISSQHIEVIPDLIITPWEHIVNTDERIKKYCENLTNVLETYTIDNLNEMYCDNLRVLLGNRNSVFDKPYCQNIKQLLDII